MTTDFKSAASRRKVLKAAAGVASLLGLGTRVAYAGKASKSAVAYRDSPNGDKNCANCKVFVSPSACKTVEGAISPNGWCKIWIKA
jgi:anaerobic selenocysteine-containing dehydrogenase